MRFPQAFSLSSTYGFNHVNAGAETFSRSFMVGSDMGNTSTNVDRSNSNNGRTGLDLNERMVEIRRSFVNPKKVEIKSRIDYLPEPNQTTLSLTKEIRVTEIIRTQEIVRTKSGQSSFPNDVTLRLNDRLGRPAFEDQINNPNPFTQQNDTRLRLYNPDHSSRHFGMNIDWKNKFIGSDDRNLLCHHNHDQHEPSAKRVDQVINLDPISVYFDESPEEKLGNSKQEFNYVNLTLQQPKPEPGLAKHLNSFPPIISLDNEDEEDPNENSYEVGDGRTHSLPHQKYGPYTCPRCRGVFVTSQLFAAHMGSHYKMESRNEKSRRRAAKSRRKNIHLLHTKYGLSVLPKTFKPSEAKKKWRKSTLWISDEEYSTEEKKAGVAGENGGVRLDGLFGVGVKLQLP